VLAPEQLFAQAAIGERRQPQPYSLRILDHERSPGEVRLSPVLRKWKAEHGQEVSFTSSFAGSETVTNQILQGVSADVAILSIERDATRLKDANFVTTDCTIFRTRELLIERLS
jgi:hypothetical protein